MAKVEPFRNRLGNLEPGVWALTCDCEHTRPVNDSKTNFRCERPIVDAKDIPCKLRHKLLPLVLEYREWKAKEDAAAFLATVERKKQEAMTTLGLTEAQVNGAKNQPVTESSSKEK